MRTRTAADPVLDRYKKTCKEFKDFRELLQYQELAAVNHRHAPAFGMPCKPSRPAKPARTSTCRSR